MVVSSFGLPGQRRGDEDAVIVDEVDEGLAVAGKAGEAVEPGAVAERPADVELALELLEAAAEQLHLAERLRHRALADIVDDAARAGLAVQHRVRPAHDVDALGAIGVERQEGGELRAGHGEAVAEEGVVAGVDAADLESVAARVHAVLLAADAGRVAQRRVDRLRRLGGDLIGGDDGDGLRHLDDRRIGLGAGVRAGGDIAVGAVAGDVDGVELDGALRRSAGSHRGRALDGHGVLRGDAIGDAGAGQQRGERLGRRQRAGDAGRGQAFEVGGAVGELHAGLVGELAQRAAERLAGDGEAARLLRRRRGGDEPGAEKPEAEGGRHHQCACDCAAVPCGSPITPHAVPFPVRRRLTRRRAGVPTPS